jgi:hypothetical protein
VRCKYAPGKNIVFHVEHGSNPSYLSLLVKFVAGDGDVVQMDLKREASPEWQPMHHSWGAVWRIIDPHRPLKSNIERVRQEARRHQRHPGELEVRRRLPVQHPVLDPIN